MTPDLNAIRARLTATSPGGNWRADVEFLSHARQDVPALLDEVVRLRAIEAKVKALQGARRELRVIGDDETAPLNAVFEAHTRYMDALAAVEVKDA